MKQFRGIKMKGGSVICQPEHNRVKIDMQTTLNKSTIKYEKGEKCTRLLESSFWEHAKQIQKNE